MQGNRVSSIVSLIVFIVLVAAAAASGGAGPDAWYRQIAKPSWTPPGWLFGPVWTLLYIAIAVSGWMVWRRSGGRITPVLVVWGVQLLLNAAWSIIFFRLHQPGGAFVDIIALWISIGVLVFMTFAVSRLAGALLIPYWLWVSFAAALNFAIWRMNVR